MGYRDEAGRKKNGGTREGEGRGRRKKEIKGCWALSKVSLMRIGEDEEVEEGRTRERKEQ